MNLGNYFLFFSFFVGGACLANPISISDNGEYPNFCQMASCDDFLFSHFKRNPNYTPILEHVSFEQGLLYLSATLNQNPNYMHFLESFRKNDLIGDPYVFPYGEFGVFSPTTLRYLKVLSDLEMLFGSLDEQDIIEIGGGYGGQCLLIGSLFKYKSYTIVDLPGPLSLTKRYLDAVGITNVSLITQEELRGDKFYDLAISNYAFSECQKDIQEVYLQKILSRSRQGYLTCNIWEGSSIDNAIFNQGFFSKQDLKDRLEFHGIHPVELKEEPQTAAENYLLVWTDQQIGLSCPL